MKRELRPTCIEIQPMVCGSPCGTTQVHHFASADECAAALARVAVALRAPQPSAKRIKPARDRKNAAPPPPAATT